MERASPSPILRPSVGPQPGFGRASRAELESLLRNNPSPFLVIDSGQLQILAVNAALTRDLGYSESELVGKKVSNFLSAQEASRLGKLLIQGQAARPLLSKSSWQLSRRDGRPIRYEVSPSTVRFCGRDALILHHPAEDTAPIFEGPEADAGSSAPNRLAQFSFSAFHDLKEPLHFVSGYLQLLEERSSGFDDEQREFLHYALQGTERIQALVMGLLDYFRMGAQSLSPEPVHLEAVLAEALETLRLSAQEEGAVITHDALPSLMLDRLQMGRLFQNLLSNAIKFRGPELPRIHVGARSEDGGWHLWVRDNGIGVPAKDAERVFEPFQRLHSQDKYPGTGLGLSTCRRIVEAHGGRIWIEPNPGAGTTVHVFLPPRR